MGRVDRIDILDFVRDLINSVVYHNCRGFNTQFFWPPKKIRIKRTKKAILIQFYPSCT